MPKFVSVDCNTLVPESCHSLDRTVNGVPLFAAQTCNERCISLVLGLISSGESETGFTLRHNDVMNHLFTINAMLEQVDIILDLASDDAIDGKGVR